MSKLQYRIGYFSTLLEQKSIIKGIIDCIDKNNSKLILFNINTNNIYENQFEVYCDLAKKFNLNGIILNNMNDDVFKKNNSIQNELFNISFQEINNKNLIKYKDECLKDNFNKLLEHFIENHNKKNLIFTCFGVDKKELEFVKEILVEKNIYKENIILSDEIFEKDLNIDYDTKINIIINELYKIRKLNFDAIISNRLDDALAIYNKIIENKEIKIDEILIGTFENNEKNKFCSEEICTVSSPLYDYGYKSCEDLLYKINEKFNDENEINISKTNRILCNCNNSTKENNAINCEKEENLNEFMKKIITCFNLDEIKDHLNTNLNKMGIQNCYIYHLDQINQSHYSSKLYFAYPYINIFNEFNEYDRIFHENNVPFFVDILYVNNKLVGILIIEYKLNKWDIYNSLPISLSSAMFSSELMENYAKANIRITNQLNIIKEIQKQLIVGIAHEINTPLGVALTSSSFILSNIKTIISDINENKLSKTYLLKTLNNLIDAGEILNQNVLKSSNTINEFKKVSISLKKEEITTFNFKKCIEDVLNGMALETKNIKHKINIKCDDNFIISSYYIAIYEMIYHLIYNACIHAFEENEVGNIVIEIKKDFSIFQVIISDNGKGIEREMLKKIFDPFYTTARNNGRIGLGLSVVYNIVSQILAGTIICRSTQGYGTQFFIEF